MPETSDFRAFLATETDGRVERGPTTLGSSDLPEGDVTIRVGWSSINYKDALATIPKGGVARISPLVPGIDLAGEVVAADSGQVLIGKPAIVTGYELGVSHHGGWAEFARVPADWVVPLPDGLTDRQAMAIGTAGLTAGLSIQALEDRGLTPEAGPVLVLGASGGVGSTAVGSLATAGYEVHAVTGKADQHAFLRTIGAHEVHGRELLEEGAGRPLSKGRWAGVVDPIGGAGTAYALRSSKHNGTVALSGLTAGVGFETTVMPFILRGLVLLGIDSAYASNELRRRVWERLADPDDLRPRGLDEQITREVDLDGIEPVIEQLLAGRAVGRAIVRVA